MKSLHLLLLVAISSACGQRTKDQSSLTESVSYNWQKIVQCDQGVVIDVNADNPSQLQLVAANRSIAEYLRSGGYFAQARRVDDGAKIIFDDLVAVRAGSLVENPRSLADIGILMNRYEFETGGANYERSVFRQGYVSKQIVSSQLRYGGGPLDVRTWNVYNCH